MANPIETLTKVVGFGIQQGTKVLGGAISTVQGLAGNRREQEAAPEPSPQQQRQQRQQRAASQRRASRQPKKLDDVTITRKVETETFRLPGVEKGKISVNTAEGVVWLRGEAKTPEQVKQLEAAAAAIPEVKRVENLLHLPGTPAPSRTDTPAPQRKTRRSRPKPAARKVTPSRTTAEKRTTAAPKEPAPSEVARTGAGRPPAPLGGDGEGGSGNGGTPSSG